MDLLSILLSLLLLAPPIVIAAFWWAARQRVDRRRGELPDAEALILARVGGIVCALLPVLQMGVSLVRYKTGEAGLYLWYLLPLFGTCCWELRYWVAFWHTRVATSARSHRPWCSYRCACCC